MFVTPFRSGEGSAFRPVVPKCARLQRLWRAAGCFGEKAATPNPGRGLRFPARRATNRHCPHPHPNAAVQNRGLTVYNRTADLAFFGSRPICGMASWGVSLLRGAPRALPWTCKPLKRLDLNFRPFVTQWLSWVLPGDLTAFCPKRKIASHNLARSVTTFRLLQLPTPGTT